MAAWSAGYVIPPSVLLGFVIRNKEICFTAGYAIGLQIQRTDNQGSLIALIDESGNVVRKYAYDPWGARRNASDWTQKDNGSNLIINRGYTGHEHLDAFGIINMNGRVYDPLTAQFFSPDPALNGSNWLSYNRYGYCMGNPFRYSDPSGNNPLLIAAAIGGFVNLGIQLVSGNIHNAGQFFGAFAVGALAGLTGSWIGGLASAALGTSVGIGAINGAIVGAGAGAAGGFIGGAGNAWMGGAGFGDGLMAGLKGAEMGAIAGGLIGGISSGISVANHGGDFLTGDGATFDVLKTELPQTSGKDGGPVDYNNTSAKKFSMKWFKEPKGLNDIHADGTVSKGYTIKGDSYFNPKGQEVGAYTRYSDVTKMSDVYLPKTVFNSHDALFIAMQHEYIHVAFMNLGWSGSTNSQEVAAYKVSIRQAEAWGLNTDELQLFKSFYQNNSTYYSPNLEVDYSRTIRTVRPW